MTQEVRESLAKLLKANADKEMSLSSVIKSNIDALKDDKIYLGEGSYYAKIVTENRSQFIRLFNLCMPHYTPTGSKKPVACDWREIKGKESMEKLPFFNEYKITVEEDAVSFHGEAMRTVTMEREMKKTEIIKFESGYEMEVPSRDAEGKVMKEVRAISMYPAEKTVWGYTETVMNAFILALEKLEAELDKK